MNVLDRAGRVIWSRDPLGIITYTEYDQTTGAQVKVIRDVDTTHTSDFSNLPGTSGTDYADLTAWTTPTGAGKHLVSTTEVDALGRPTKIVDAGGNVTYVVYNDVSHEIRTYPGFNSTTGLTTGSNSVVRVDQSRGYMESLTFSAAPHLDGTGRPDGAETITSATIQSLSRSYRDASGLIVSVDAYFSLDGLTYTPATPLGMEGTHYLRTSTSYDSRARPNRVVNAAGTISRFVFDSLGRVVSTWTGTNDTPASGSWSPSNNGGTSNMVQVSEQQYDGNDVGNFNLTLSRAVASGSTTYDTVKEYDWRDRLIASRGPDNVATKRTYDNRGNVTQTDTFADADADLVIDSGELRGRTTSLLDENGRVYRTSVFNVDPTTGTVGNALTSNVWYDQRGLVAKTADPNGLFKKTSYDALGRPVFTYVSYDASETSYANALTVTGDTVVEQSQAFYDSNHNLVAGANYLRLENDSSTSGALTAANSYATGSATWYDRANRPTGSADFGHESGSTGTRYLFNTSNQVIDTDSDGIPDVSESSALLPNTSDNYLATKLEYDAAGRSYRATDNKGRTTQITYDLMGRTVSTIQNYTDGVAGETETDTDRTTQNVYDGHGRLSKTIVLNPKGSGNGVEQQATTYLYESPFNGAWVTSTIFADSADTSSTGTDQVKTSYDRLGRTSTTTDQRGVVHTFSYDSAGRALSDAVTTLPTGVDGAVRRLETTYDDLSRPLTLTSFDAAASGTVVNEVKFTYDGWGNVSKTEQAHGGAVGVGTPAVQYAYEDGAVSGEAKFVRLRSVTYPSGRTVYYNYDGTAVNRLASVSDDSSATTKLADYTYLGADTVVQVAHPEVTGGLTLSFGASGTYAGWDRFGRVVDQAWKTTGGTALDRFEYAYDRASNRTSRQVAAASAPSNLNLDEAYTYDGADRLARVNRGTLDSNGTITDANATFHQTFTVDAAGNWRSLDDDGTTQTRTADAANETTGVTGSAGWVSPAYDAAGNMTSGPKAGSETTRLHFIYDAWNRLVKVQADDGTGQPGSVVATYAYDARGFRTQKTVGSTTTDLYYNEDWQVLQESSGGNAVAQYVWDDARYTDAPILRDRDTDANGSLEERLYYTQDANFNATALVTTSGSVVERYSYDTYGKLHVYDGSWSSRTASAYDNRIVYSGYWLDVESSLLLSRHRLYHPTLGTWISRDPAGFPDGFSLYEYVGGRPTGSTDPSGLCSNDNMAWLADKTEAILQITGGAIETAIGIATIESGLGVLAILHGADNISAGVLRLLKLGDGRTATNSLITQAAMAVLGVDESAARMLGNYGDVIVSAIATMGLSAGASSAAAVGRGGLGCVVASSIAGAAKGAVAGAAIGAVVGGVTGYLRTGTFAGALAGAEQGAVDGAIAGAIVGGIHGAANPSTCFVAGTQVVTGLDPNHPSKLLTKSIEDIQVGDYVVARDQSNERDNLDLRRVVQVFRRTSDHLRIVRYKDSRGNVETIKTTDEHPFWVEAVGWLRAGDLEAGMHLDQPGDLDAVVLLSVREEHPEGIAVFNFEVEDDHTYFVEDGRGRQTPVWVHNSCAPYDVGPYNKLDSVGDDLAKHHVAQKHMMAKLVPGYDAHTAPAIAIPTNEHLRIVPLRGNPPPAMTPRSLLARDISNLKAFTRAPRSALRSLIDLNKSMYSVMRTR